MENEEIIVYHGTTNECALSILNMNKFIQGKDNNEDFLGEGIYFFDNYKHALLWNIKDYNKRCNSKFEFDEFSKLYDILDVIIQVKRENILDLDDNSDIVKFDKIVKKIAGILDILPEYIDAENKNSAILNFLQKKGYIDDIYIVKQSIKQKLNVDKRHSINYIFREVICVKNDKVIKLIDLHDKISKKEFEDAAYLSFLKKRYI